MGEGNGTVDFARAGTIARLFNMWVPFLNARAQGTLVMGKALLSKESFMTNPSLSAFNIATMIGIPAYAAYAWNRRHFSDLYDQIPDAEKERNFIIVKGAKEDRNGNMAPHYVKIPKGEAGEIFANPIEAFLDWAYKNQRPDVLKMGLQALSDISPVSFEQEGEIAPGRFISGFLPPPMRAGLEVAFNKNFYFGSEVVPQALQDVATKSLQYTERTPKSLVWLGNKTGLSPMQMEHFLRASFGGGVYQVIDPFNLDDRLQEAVVQTRGGAFAQEVFRFREEFRGEKADLRVRMEHEITKMLIGDGDEQKAAQDRLAKLLVKVPKDRGAYFRNRLEKVLGKKLPEQERALRALTREERAAFLRRRAEATR